MWKSLDNINELIGQYNGRQFQHCFLKQISFESQVNFYFQG